MMDTPTPVKNAPQDRCSCFWFVVFVGCIILLPIFPFSSLAQVNKTSGIKKPALNEWTFRARLIANPHNRDANRARCEILDKQQRYRELADERVAWLADNPEDYSEVISLDTEAIFLLNDGEIAIAATRKYFAALASDDPMFGWANNFLGTELMRRRRCSEAIPYLRKAVEKNPDFADYYEALGNALVDSGQTEGIGILKRGVELQPSSARIHESLARAFEKSGNLADAETEYKAARNLGKANSMRLTTLARLQIKRREFADARDTIDRALKMNRTELYAYLLRARIRPSGLQYPPLRQCFCLFQIQGKNSALAC